MPVQKLEVERVKINSSKVVRRCRNLGGTYLHSYTRRYMCYRMVELSYFELNMERTVFEEATNIEGLSIQSLASSLPPFFSFKMT